MKRIIKNPLLTFILGALIFGSIGVVSAYTIFANDIGYTPKDTSWEVDNVKDAIDDLYIEASKPLIDRIDFSKKNDIIYGNWATSRSVSINLDKGSYIIFLEYVDSYSSYNQTATSINRDVTTFSNNLVYSTGTCEIIDGDSISVGSSSGIDNTNVHVTAYSNTKVFKCNFTDSTTVSYTHSRPTAYSNVVELFKLRSIKLD